MSGLDELYQELILDHNRNPRNFRESTSANHHLEGYNPLCGDRLTLYIEIAEERIKDICFKGSGCAISTASASLMTEAIKGKNIQDAKQLFSVFQKALIGQEPIDLESLGKLAALAGVRKFPIRVKCATLAWHTLESILEGHDKPVSTE
ncbi:MAG: SUF system NifU family Fe-S cluster assembly protein [Chlamydiota bacterium]|nr:SUF system NifU family Fe-S cluster assembly protein [Chlamydiota bacterium]